MTDGNQVEVALKARLEQPTAIEAAAESLCIIAQLGEKALLGPDISILLSEAVTCIVQTLKVEYAAVLELEPAGKRCRPHPQPLSIQWRGEICRGAEGHRGRGAEEKLYSEFSTQDSGLSTQHSGLNTQHSALNIQHSTHRYAEASYSTQDSALSTFLVKAGIGWPDGIVGEMTFDADPKTLSGYNLLSEQPTRVADWHLETRFAPTPLLENQPVTSSLSVLIQGRKRPFGVLEVHTRQRRDFSDSELHFLQAIAYIIATAQARKQAEAVCYHSEGRLKLALEAAQMGTWDWNLETGELIWSRNNERLFGLAPGSFGGTYAAFISCVHPQDREFVLQGVKTAFAQKTEYNQEFRTVWPNGTIRWIAGKGQFFYHEMGIRMIGVCVDITEQKQAMETLSKFASELEVRVEERTAQLQSANTILKLQMALGQRAAQEIRREKEFSDTLINSIGDGILAFDRDYRYTVWNPAMERITGLSRTKVFGECAFELFPFLKETGEDEYLRAAIAGRSIAVTDRLYHIPQTTRQGFYEAYYSPLHNESGDIIGGLGIIRDITQRKKAEEERTQLLREQAAHAEAEAARRRLAFLAEASTVLASSLDYQITLKSIARLAVPYMADWCNIDLLKEDGTMSRLMVAPAVHTKKQEELQERGNPTQNQPTALYGFQKVLHTGKAEFYPHISDPQLAAHLHNAEGLAIIPELVPKSYICVPLIARGRKLGTISFMLVDPDRRYTPEDLTLAEDLAHRVALAVDNVRLYQQAQEANRLKDEFLAILSHELRTPINAIQGWAHLLRTRQFETSTIERALETIERNARTQTQMIEDLLDVSRIIQGKLRLNLRPVNPNPIIEASIEALKPTALAKKIQLISDLEPGISLVCVDSDRLQQIVWNLLSNAIKFTPDGGQVEVKLSTVLDQGIRCAWGDGKTPTQNSGLSSSYIQIQVCDTGQGINPEFLPYVFDRFRQENGSLTRSHGGLGIGLAIVRHLVELHGGTVSANSPGEGQGATFTVRLPLLAEVRSERARSEGSSSLQTPNSSPLKGLRVLVVDDEADTRELVATVLQEYGAEAIVAASVREALKALQCQKPDILVSDIGMPGEDGYTLMRRVQALMSAHGTRIPTIALTAYAREQDREQALKAGFGCYLSKPVEAAQLVEAIASLAGKTAPPTSV